MGGQMDGQIVMHVVAHEDVMYERSVGGYVENYSGKYFSSCSVTL